MKHERRCKQMYGIRVRHCWFPDIQTICPEVIDGTAITSINPYTANKRFNVCVLFMCSFSFSTTILHLYLINSFKHTEGRSLFHFHLSQTWTGFMIVFYNKFPSKLTYVCLKSYFEVKITAYNTVKKKREN